MVKTRRTIKKIEAKKKTKIERLECPICLNRIEKEDICRPNHCSHMFCLKCIKEWSKVKETCPVCRTLYESIILKTTKEIILLQDIYEEYFVEYLFSLFPRRFQN